MAKTIMVVDDSASLRQVVGIALKGAGYDVIEGRDGADALTKCTGQKIHLVVCDVNMPNMDGITFVKEFKKLASYRFTPVIMLSSAMPRHTSLTPVSTSSLAWAASCSAGIMRLIIKKPTVSMPS